MRKRKQKPRRARRGRDLREWVGARVLSPVYVTEDKPYRPEMILWMELPKGLVVHSQIIDPKQAPIPFGDTLLEAMKKPMVGPPRRPSRVRVHDSALAHDIQRVAPNLEVVVAPTPEIDTFMGALLDASLVPDKRPSYVEGGRISAECVSALFHAAELIYRAAPWNAATDDQILRLDIPQLGIKGACVSIIGRLGESVGFIIFPSRSGYSAFAAMTPGSLDLGTPLVALNFERGADIAESMRREIIAHNWPVAGPAAYPWVAPVDRDGSRRPLTEADLHVVTASASALAAFFAKHGRIFEDNASGEPISESFLYENVEVRLEVPYDAETYSTANDTRAPDSDPFVDVGDTPGGNLARAARTEPSAYNSGQTAPGGDEETRTASAIRRLERRLLEQIVRYGADRFGRAWFDAADVGFRDPNSAMQLFGVWSIHHAPIQGKPLAEWYIEERGIRASRFERRWFGAQKAAWLSIWEVLEVDPEQGIALIDLLTGEKRTVHATDSRPPVVCRDSLLGRVVDHGEVTLLDGNHPSILPPNLAAVVVEGIRRRLRRRTFVPPERMRDVKIGRHLVRLWEAEVDDLCKRSTEPPMLRNTDGNDLVLTVDHFTFDPARCADVEARLTAMAGVQIDEAIKPERCLVLTRPGNTMNPSWENTIIARVLLADSTLRLETNSRERADAARERVETTCGGLIHHRAREHTDPQSAAVPGRERPGSVEASDDLTPEVTDRLAVEIKARHYATWLDQPLPALDGKTPRDAARTQAGRTQVDLLLKSMENMEARLPETQRFDFSRFRHELLGKP